MSDQSQELFTTTECLAKVNDRLQRLQRIIEARAVAYGDDPAGATGLYERRFKILGSEYPVIEEEYRLDRPLLRAELALLKQAAQLTRDSGTERDAEASTLDIMRLINEGRDRVAKAHRERVAKEAAAKGEQQHEPVAGDVPPFGSNASSENLPE